MHTSRLALVTAVLISGSAQAQFGAMSMMNPLSMMMPMTMMAAPMMGSSMMNPMSMMMPMTMMAAPMMGSSMMNPMSMMVPMSGFGSFGGYGSLQPMMSNPYANPMGAVNPYLKPAAPVQQQPSFFPMMPTAAPQAPVPAYGAYQIFAPAAPQQAVSGTQLPVQSQNTTPMSGWTNMFAPPVATAPQKAPQAAATPAKSSDPMFGWTQTFMPANPPAAATTTLPANSGAQDPLFNWMQMFMPATQPATPAK